MMSRSRSIRGARTSISKKLSPYFHTSAREVARSILPYLSAMVRNDPELLVSLGMELELDEGDIAYLLGVEPGAASVKRAMSSIQALRSGETQERPVGQGKASRSRAGNLSDF